jgi:endonuclease/exonuclease/phosphatase family metal-dependent hydrolase
VLRVATFNIRHGKPQGRRDVDLTGYAAAVHALDADVLGLQEVDVDVPRSGRCDLAGLAIDACEGRTGHFAPALDLHGGRYGVALVVRGTLDDVEDLRLLGEGETRVATIARATVRPRDPGPGTEHGDEHPAPELTVAVTHLQAPSSGRPHEARLQLGQVLDALDERPGPHLLMGDLNLGPAWVQPLLERRGFEVADAPPTFPARRPTRRIDWIAVRGGRIGVAVVPDVRTSDHRPLVATVALGPSALGTSTRTVT